MPAVMMMMHEYHKNESDDDTDKTILRMFDVEECLSTNDHQKFKESKDVEHRMELDDEVPEKEIYRRISHALFDSVRKEIGKIVEAGVIRESPYCSPVTIVTKEDHTPIICIYFRKLNMKSEKDSKGVQE